jgi:hypothetical protein
MSRAMVEYLEREHARLDNLIQREASAKFPDEVLIARLKKLKLTVKDQMVEAEHRIALSQVA